jgi:hypothetical protein
MAIAPSSIATAADVFCAAAGAASGAVARETITRTARRQRRAYAIFTR